MRKNRYLMCLGLLAVGLLPAQSQELIGISVTPHNQSSAMRWRTPPDPELAARIELFIGNPGDSPIELDGGAAIRLDGTTPAELIEAGKLAWHDTPGVWQQGEISLMPGTLTVLALNGRSASWGTGTKHRLQLGGSLTPLPFTVDAPIAWLSAVTFLSSADDPNAEELHSIYPSRMVVHLVNDDDESLAIRSVRLWLPQKGQSHHIFHASDLKPMEELNCFPASGTIARKSRGGFVVETGPLPLTYGVVEVRVDQRGNEHSVWSFLRIKREAFDISGGWVASDVNGRNSLTLEPYLKTLKRVHINTGQIEEVGGYTDNSELYQKYPLKRFNRLQDLTRYDRAEMLPQIHAVEFLGEPQYGGGRPVSPQEVWEQLAPYQRSRLATTVTLSEERNWRYYAGLSDYPHYDAYRVIAPAADSWRSYDRWDGQSIRWGAPLETIGDMTRSLRELNRPRSIAYWSQGAHDGWGSRFNPRRGSPTPNELRSQAWHGLANRVTSLYWFNLSLPSLVKFRDLIDPITRVNREINLVSPILLAGDAFEYRRLNLDGRPDWDLCSVASPDALLMVAHDLSYRADPDLREFVFTPRQATLSFRIPTWLDPDQLGRQPAVFRLDADGTHDVQATWSGEELQITDRIDVVGIYVLASDQEMRSKLDEMARQLIQQERQLGFDPAGNDRDFEALRSLIARE